MKTIDLLHSKTRTDFIKTMYVIATCIMIVEIFVLALDIATGQPTLNVKEYLITFVWCPSSYNFAMCIIATIINSLKISDNKKNYGIIFCMTKICAAIAIIHSVFISTQCVFVGSIIAAALLGNSNLIKFATIDAVAMLVLSIILAPYFDNTMGVDQLTKSAIVSTAVLILTGIMSDTIVKARERHESTLRKYIVDLEKTSKEARCDGMTKLYNHVEFYNALYRLRKQGVNQISLVIIDIDRFKHINDTYGHKNGDIVILKLAEQLLMLNNDVDTFAFRYGGEEFALIFVDKPHSYVDVILQNLKTKVLNMEFNFDTEKRITISAGVLDCDLQVYSNEEMFIRADKALYFSKQNGRNQINRYNDLSDEQIASTTKQAT